jgi:hypothetical protein
VNRVFGHTLPYVRFWDPNLNELKGGEGGAVSANARVIRAEDMAAALGLELQPGDQVWRVCEGAFVNEKDSQGRLVVTLDALDEDGRQASGARITCGWPQHKLPEFDEITEILPGEHFTQGYGNFVGKPGEPLTASSLGPYFFGVYTAGGDERAAEKLAHTDLVVGAGLPDNRHVMYRFAFIRTTYEAPPQPVMLDTKYEATIDSRKALITIHSSGLLDVIRRG